MTENKKKLAVIGCVGIPAKYGGFETFAEKLVEKLSYRFDITVDCSGGAYPEREETYKGAKLYYIPLKANGIQSIFYDIYGIAHALGSGCNSLLILGVSGCAFLPLLRFFGCRRKIVVNIDGLEWHRKKWNWFAAAFLKFSERCAVRCADYAIGDNRVITDYIRKTYGKDGLLIEYGADHVQTSAKEKNAPDYLEKPYAFAVARIEPENNIHLILEAFRKSGKNLVCMGNWERSEYGKSLLKQYSEATNIHMLPAVYDQNKLDILRSNCALYIHGHSCGGTNPSLVEAMYLGRDIAAFDVNFNRETTENKASYFSGADELAYLSRTGVSNGSTMREIARKRYTWERIAALYENALR